MTTTNPYRQKPTAEQNRSTFGPRHNPIGTDADGGHHHWNRDTNTIYVINNGSVEHREALDAHPDKSISDWVDYVEAKRSWQNCKFISLSASDLADTHGGH